jgi:hypothetical protein
MSKQCDYGPLQTFRIIHKNGKVEDIKAHQCLMHDDLIKFHGEYDGEWKLALAISPYQVQEVRNLSIPRPTRPFKQGIVERFRKMRGQFREGLK